MNPQILLLQLHNLGLFGPKNLKKLWKYLKVYETYYTKILDFLEFLVEEIAKLLYLDWNICEFKAKP